MQNVNPALGATPLTVPKASDFTMTWTAGTTAGSLAYLGIDASKTGVAVSDGTITCFDKDSTGTITVPKALLANMTTGDDLTIGLNRLTTNTVATGNVTVTVDAFAQTAGTGTLQ
jgi:hypothetical protein